MIFEVKKLDPNVWLGHQGETALHTAAKNGYADFTKFLLESGANVNQKGINNILKSRHDDTESPV